MQMIIRGLNNFKFSVKIIVLLILVFSQNINAGDGVADRPKIGLVLAGGGAKGFAHVGILKMIDSLNIPIDYIAGTSMGAIIGALYAIGYSGAEIEVITTTNDWELLFSDEPPRSMKYLHQKIDDGKYNLSFGFDGFIPVPPAGVIRGQSISLLFSELTISAQFINDFDDLYIPFRCVAADLITGNEVILEKGSIAMAMRATMSIPTAFTPVPWGDSLLVDGGIINNLPVDVARKMGADYIIAVDVGRYQRPREELNNLLTIMEQSTNIPTLNRLQEQRADANILIIPDVLGFSTADFQKGRVVEIIETGKIAAKENLSKFLNLKKSLGNSLTDDPPVVVSSDKTIIHGVSITGNTSIPHKELYNQLGMFPGDTLNIDFLNEKLVKIHERSRVAGIQYQLTPLDTNKVRVAVNIRETEFPIIHGVRIQGNINLPFTFLNQHIGIKPGDRFDPDLVTERINNLYSLGYFETIHYEIEPVAEDKIRLTIVVTEFPKNKLEIGFHYSDYYKLVGRIGVKSTNFIFPGLQMIAAMQFSGLFRLDVELAYPSRGLNLPFFPYIQAKMKDIPIGIYDSGGNRIASYDDRSSSIIGGIALQLARSAIVEAELAQEEMNVVPSVALREDERFPEWHERLRKIQARLIIDHLDDMVLPGNGLHFEGEYEQGFKELGSAVSYTRTWLNLNYYFSFLKRNTVRLNSYYCWAGVGAPEYKFYYLGGIQTFIGMDYDQLVGIHMLQLRMDYRYQIARDWYLELVGNVARNLGERYPHFNMADQFFGAGIGLKHLSIIGPMEIVVARGNSNINSSDQFRFIIYFRAGVRL